MEEDKILVDTTGYSMWPFIRAGEKVFVKKSGIEELSRGDIILYRKDGELRLHRLVNKTEDEGEYTLYSRGDNSNSPPERVGKEMYIGKAVAVLRNGKLIDFSCGYQALINRCIIMLNPFFNRILKPLYKACRKAVRGGQ
jgi:signal peptidase I